LKETGPRQLTIAFADTLVWPFHLLRRRNLVWGFFCQAVIFNLRS